LFPSTGVEFANNANIELAVASCSSDIPLQICVLSFF
jgi:hypothetical protein